MAYIFGPISICKTTGLVSQCQQKSNHTSRSGWEKGQSDFVRGEGGDQILIRGEKGIKEILLDEVEIKQIF